MSSLRSRQHFRLLFLLVLILGLGSWIFAQKDHDSSSEHKDSSNKGSKSSSSNKSGGGGTKSSSGSKSTSNVRSNTNTHSDTGSNPRTYTPRTVHKPPVNSGQNTGTGSGSSSSGSTGNSGGNTTNPTLPKGRNDTGNSTGNSSSGGSGGGNRAGNTGGNTPPPAENHGVVTNKPGETFHQRLDNAGTYHVGGGGQNAGSGQGQNAGSGQGQNQTGGTAKPSDEIKSVEHRPIPGHTNPQGTATTNKPGGDTLNNPGKNPSGGTGTIRRSDAAGSGNKNFSHITPTYDKPMDAHVAARTPNGAVLNPQGSQHVVTQLNTSRANMHGFNARPLPQGNVTVHDSGGLTLHASGDRTYNLRPNGSVATFRRQDEVAKFRGNGQIASVHTAHLDIYHAPRGGTTIVRRLPDHTVVSYGPRAGYVQRPISVHNSRYIQRTYIYQNVTTVRIYRPVTYRGVSLAWYVPPVRYHPLFYGWAYYPWHRPVHYRWWWAGSPWVGFYAGYWTPAPYYPGPTLWLTDYVFAATLSSAYDEGGSANVEAQQPPPSDDDLYAQQATPISPELKDAIAQEVQRQIALENANANGEAPSDQEGPASWRPNQVFIVDSPLQAQTDQGQDCALSPGDVIVLKEMPQDGSSPAALQVASSQQMDCPAGTAIGVGLEDLQEMQNALRAQIDAGMQKLHDQQGQNDLPPAPPSAVEPAPQPTLDVQPPPDPNAQTLLQEQGQQANQEEQNVAQEAEAPGQPPEGQPPESLNQQPPQ